MNENQKRSAILILFLTFFFIFSSLEAVCSGKHMTAPEKLIVQAPLKIGIASMVTPVDAVKYYQNVIDYIGEQIGRPVQMVNRRTYDEMDSLLERGEVQVAFICSAPYVRNRERFGVELLVAPIVHGKSTYHSYIITHKDSPIKSFPELKGKSFAFTDPKSNSGNLYPTYLLETVRLTPNKFFSRIYYSYSHNKSVEMVAKKIVDGAAVDSLVYENMLKTASPYAKETKIIKRSPPYGIPPVVATKDISPSLRKKVKDAFLYMNKTAKGKAILAALMIDGFVEVPDKNYDTIRKMEKVAAKSVNAVEEPKDGNTIYFGVIPRDNPRIMYEKYQPLLDYLSEKTPFKYELVLKKNYEEMVNAIGSGEVDVALLGPLTYLEAHAKYRVAAILRPKGANGTASYKCVIIKRKDSPIKILSGLKGNNFAFASFKSVSGNLMPRYMLANSGLHLSDLSGYTNFDYHDSVVKAVLKGQFAAGAVRDSVAEKYMRLGIDILAESEPIPTGPLVAGRRTPNSVIEKIKMALLELNPQDGSDQRVLKHLDDDLRNGFKEETGKDYGEIRRKFNAIPQTCGRGCHPKIRL